MTEMTHVPDPEEIIEKIRAVNIGPCCGPVPTEKEKMRQVATWSIALAHCFNLEVVPRRDRLELERSCDEVGRIGAAILVSLENEQSFSLISAKYRELKEDLLYICNELDSNLASRYIEATKCQT